jgi:hypothetical protein
MEPDFAPKLRPNSSDRPPRKQLAELRETTRRFTVELRRQFADEIEYDARSFKLRVLALVKQGLPPKRGRPCDKAVTRAVEMRAQGRDWRAIYADCIPATTAGDSRQVAQSRLRSAVRARRRRRGLIARVKIESAC